MRRFLLLFSVILTAIAACATALVDGKVYQIVNANYPLAMNITGPNGNISCAAPDTKSFDQLWEAKTSGSGWAFKNLTTGTYLTSSGATSEPWRLSSSIGDKSIFTIATSGSNVTIRPSAHGSMGYGYAHCDASHTVVCWEPGSTSSQWLFSEVAVSDADREATASRLEAMNAILDNATAYAEILGRIFADKACTRLSGSPSAADLAALPAGLRAMVAKIQAGDWTESNYDNPSITWADNYARKFRVQNYEVHSRGNECAELTGIQPYTNMNNPTGIMANAYDVLFIMVDEAPKDGSTLYYGHAPGMGMYNDWQTDYPLHEGLNVVPVWTDSSMGYIYYTADTYSNHQRQHKLAEFPPIKIHIEGGLINSYYNAIGDDLYTPDTRADFNYYRERAQHPMYDILGRRSILRFFFDRTETNVGNGEYCEGVKTLLGPSADINIETMIHQWDELALTELMQMGLVSDEDILAANADKAEGRDDWYDTLAGDDIAPGDFWQYWNNRHMAITMQGNLYMDATAWRTAYNGTTLPNIINLFGGGNIWGPAHEFGHMNQAPVKIAGTTEISNNCFSNVAVFTHTDRTSCSLMSSDQIDAFINGKTFIENGTWGATRMYFQLWLYYHAAGHNKKFYPRLYQLLREQPLQKSYYLNSRYDALHFVKMCCLAAQEDLTDFFEAWGFFVPLDNYQINDYAQYIATLTPADIAAVKDEIRAYGFPRNNAILFIDDRVNSPRPSWNDEYRKELAGDLGSLADFVNVSSVTKPYSYLLSGTTVTMSGGEGGVGFIIYDENDNLIGFSNSYEFPVSSACAQAIFSGNARVEALGADNNAVVAENIELTLPDEEKAEMLARMIDDCNFYIDNVDPTMTIVGKFKPADIAHLTALQTEAKEILAKGESDRYSDIYTRLQREYLYLTQNELPRVPFVPGGTYVLTVKGADGAFAKNLIPYGGYLSTTTAKDINNAAQQWVFEPASEGKYYIKNVATGSYINAPKSYNSVPHSSEKVALSVDWKTDLNHAYIHSEGVGVGVHPTYNSVIGSQEPDNAGYHLMLTKVASDDEQEDYVALSEAIASAERLMNKAGTVSADPVKIIVTDPDNRFFSNAKCKSTSYGEQFTSFSVINDDNLSTYFHSDYSGSNSTDGLDHYIGLTFASAPVTDFLLSYSTRGAGGSPVPTRITIQGTADGKTWTDIEEIASGLPTGNGQTFTTAILHSDAPLTAVRMMVNETSGNKSGGHSFFAISEMKFYTPDFTAIPSADYPDVTEALLREAFTAIEAGKAIYDEAISGGGTEKLESAVTRLNAIADKLTIAIGRPAGLNEFDYSYEGLTVRYIIPDPNDRSVTTKPVTGATGRVVLPGNPSDGKSRYILTAIGDYGFSDCSGLTAIEIPATVSAIGAGAFDGCTGLTEIYSLSSVPPACASETTFADCSSAATLFVPRGRKAAYSLDPCWGRFDKIEEIDVLIPGDANGDGIVNINDVVLAVDATLGRPVDIDTAAADVDGSGTIDVSDIVRIVDIMLHQR